MDMPEKVRNLTPRQELFVKEYLADRTLNATQAAIRAGYSKKYANRLGCRILKSPTVAQAIKEAMDERARRTDITADKVLQQLARVAFVDMRDVLEYGPDGVKIKKSEDVDGTVLAAVSQTKEGMRVTLSDRMKALELLGRHLGMWNEKLMLEPGSSFEGMLKQLVKGENAASAGGARRPEKA